MDQRISRRLIAAVVLRIRFVNVPFLHFVREA